MPHNAVYCRMNPLLP